MMLIYQKLPPSLRAASLASDWAHKMGLKPGNMYEPALTRGILKRWREQGEDENAWGCTEALFRSQLGLDP